ncbi:ABC transporter permease [Streptacidiphilus fuscans]|uniref:ABC transporter permease n=1 Tax=Streptacidiphilus fuscans TaxID=2789292 RepID=A0A931FJH3_9ACTN|nr:ABC transporter permease [Streptacidiphilus fuscans]MBF9072754.1 ABC transporter permease [Streptacidiphilus fuscans]
MRRGIALGVAVALAFAAMSMGAFGVLLESALRAHAPVERYASAAAVVAGPQSVSVVRQDGKDRETQTRPLVERDRVPLADAARLRTVPGVANVVPDVSVPVVALPATGGAPVTTVGHGWDSAQLTSTAPTAGRAPVAADEVTLDQATAQRLGAQPGSSVELQVNAAPRQFRVVGVTPGPGVYFSQAEAESLSGHPGSADALVVLAAPGQSVSASALGRAVPGLSVSTGAARGDVEDPAVAEVRTNTIGEAATLGGTALLVTLLVVTGLMELSVRSRTRELAVLRAVGATPRQVRRVIVREMLRISVPAALLGALASLGVGAALQSWMHAQGALPPGFALRLGPFPVLAAALATVLASVGAAWLSARRISRIRPVQALGESAVEPRRMPLWRVITGLVFLALGAGMLVVTFLTGGQTAAAAVGGLVVSLIWAVALLGPWIARAGTLILGLLLRAFSPITGGLAAAGARSAALRMAAVITPVALALSFGGTQLFAQTTTVNATAAQALAGLRADQVLTSSGPGIPQDAYTKLRATPGVTAAAEVKRTTVVMNVWALGDELQSLQAQGVQGAVAQTLDPKVTAGSLDDLTGQGTVALSSMVAHGAKPGDMRQLWLGDGTSVTLRVVAVYDRGLGFGDVLLPLPLVSEHATTPLDDYLLADGHADLSGLTGSYAGLHAADRAAYGASLAETAKQQGLIGLIAVVAIAGFILIGMGTTLAVATASRRRELLLLRLIGATRRQLLGALRLETGIILGTGILVGTAVAGLTLFAYAASTTGLAMLSFPPLYCAGLLAAVLVPGAAAVLLPGRAILRRSAPRIE